MNVVGVNLGALSGIFIFFSIFAIRRYLLYALFVFLFFALFFKITEMIGRHRSTTIGILFSAKIWTLILGGTGGFIFFFSEEAYYSDSYVLKMIALAYY